MHPRDQRGLPPVNLRHGLYRLTDKPTHPVERVAFDSKSPPKLLDSTPKEFRSPAPTLLARADSPQIAVHMMHESPRTGMTGASTRAVSSSLTFDQHSNRFMLATHVTDGGHTHTFSEPMSDRGGHITPSTGEGFRGGESGGGGYSHAGGYSRRRRRPLLRWWRICRRPLRRRRIQRRWWWRPQRRRRRRLIIRRRRFFRRRSFFRRRCFSRRRRRRTPLDPTSSPTIDAPPDAAPASAPAAR